MTRIIVGPFNRVEGDLEVTLEVRDGRVAEAWAGSPLYRGFEQILRGKHPMDALMFAPRICGICSVSQSMAAASVLADAMGLTAAPNGRITRNLAHAVENIADHFTHFYLFFMPDFARAEYAGRAWHGPAAERFRAVRGSAAAYVLPVRAAFLTAMGTLVGKWPHSLAIQPGGVARALEASEKIRLFGLLRDFRRHLETVLFGDALEAVAALGSEAALARWAAEKPRGDFGAFLGIADDLNLDKLGRGVGRFMSYGGYPQEAGLLLPRGIWNGGLHALDEQAIAEDVSHAWLDGETRHPAQGVTRPQDEKAEGYTWCKAPRLAGLPMETGALARQVVAGHPLARNLAARGGDVKSRVVARLLEIALILPEMEKWVRQLVPGEPFCAQGEMPGTAAGAGLVEAARGALGHWISVADGRIANYQIISPTTWNFSPRDTDGMPGPLEQALVGAPAGEGDVAVQHVVRSFDPCMVCTVH
ncbi:MAG: nickel-dependent hydrogenase large subunit [Candidatus Nitricoxidivorans perseverans]|uniref:Nickel-dependent hydrogenase large subunit n=1 Tax=Candidatus Nitricoxidivorans perseverans TaxID=2975601 RepID=A0AA49FJP2_9PROT|nr:MAG: nickel-dependent hydrogenase large subunit [Candidatus Nitricoxidivorans perseverans]